MICGYHTLIDWNKVNDDDVTALVELRVTPQGGEGYQKLAEKINAYPQVVTLYLMSGAYDFLVMVKGKTLKEISLFVSGKLASIEEVQSTTTHFTLTKYKELGVSFEAKQADERMVVTTMREKLSQKVLNLKSSGIRAFLIWRTKFPT